MEQGLIIIFDGAGDIVVAVVVTLCSIVTKMIAERSDKIPTKWLEHAHLEVLS